MFSGSRSADGRAPSFSWVAHGRVPRGLLVLWLLVVVAGCGSRSGSVVGKWEADGKANTIEFTDDGHIKQRRPGHIVYTWYRIEGDQMTVGHIMSGAPDETVRFEVAGNTLTIGSCMALGTRGATKFTRVQE
jgi:hypothetical protein